ncbi:MAG: DUF6370 family protein [Bacteroidetes bacterium]|nr:DUF6370 family protein [Bacteroidota bacterium]
MKAFFLILAAFFIVNTASAQQTPNKIAVPDSTKKIQVVEASCGECNFKMPGKGCELAVRINGKAYFVDGTSIDEHGDAHGADGFCEAIRKAEVQGEIVNNRFKATYFKLLKPEPKKN